jgi:hypothetical protein
MIGIKKSFSKKLHRQNDPASRRIVKEYFSKQGIIIEDNPDKFGVDLLSKDGTLKIEVEHRLVWIDDDFPFAEVNVPERKAKFFVENSVAYVILSRDYSRLGMIDGKTLRQYIVDFNLKESPNKYVKENEYFYKIPRNIFKWVKL